MNGGWAGLTHTTDRDLHPGPPCRKVQARRGRRCHGWQALTGEPAMKPGTTMCFPGKVPCRWGICGHAKSPARCTSLSLAMPLRPSDHPPTHSSNSQTFGGLILAAQSAEVMGGSVVVGVNGRPDAGDNRRHAMSERRRRWLTCGEAGPQQAIGLPSIEAQTTHIERALRQFKKMTKSLLQCSRLFVGPFWPHFIGTIPGPARNRANKWGQTGPTKSLLHCSRLFVSFF